MSEQDDSREPTAEMRKHARVGRDGCALTPFLPMCGDTIVAIEDRTQLVEGFL